MVLRTRLVQLTAVTSFLVTLAFLFSGCPAATPTVTAFSPLSGNPGIAVTITGTNLDQATAVTFNGLAATYYVDSPTQITALAPDTTGLITIAYSGGTVATSASFSGTHSAPVIAALQAPTLSAAEGASLVFSGSNFTGVSQVSFAGQSATFSVDSDSQLSVIVPVPSASVGGIMVINPYGIGYQNFSTDIANSGNLPIITALSATRAAAGATITVTGMNFYSSNTAASNMTRVRFGSVVAQSTTVDNNHLSVIVPAGAPDGPITVENEYGQAASGANFARSGHLPAISRVWPAFGPVGTSVTITGDRLLGASIQFNGTTASPLSVSSNLITVKVPTGAKSGAIVVSTPHGNATSPFTFTVGAAPTAKPVITSFGPAMGTHGSWIAITGTGFSAATQVTIGGYAAQFVVDSDTQITALVPQVSTPNGIIGVVTPAGTSYSASIFSSLLYSPAEAPMIYGLSQTTASVGQSVTLSGWGFSEVFFVRVGGVNTTFTTSASTTLTFTVPAGATSGPIIVGTPMGLVQSGIDLIVN